MNVLYLMIPMALLLAAIALFAFFWAVRKGQMDDLDSPPYRALFDDEPKRKPPPTR